MSLVAVSTSDSDSDTPPTHLGGAPTSPEPPSPGGGKVGRVGDDQHPQERSTTPLSNGSGPTAALADEPKIVIKVRRQVW